MNFLNPIEILELQNYELSEIDINLIKKAKKKVLAEIELSDEGNFNYKGHKINKSEIQNVLNNLDNKDFIEFFYFIANYDDLNFFLTTGNESIFLSFKQESIYKLPEFIKFISPYFAKSYDKALFKSFRNNNEALLQKIISVKPLVIDSDLESSFKSIENSIRARIKEIEKITSDIKNDECHYDVDDIYKTLDEVVELLNVRVINLLPHHFQNIRNKCANSIRNLSVNIFNSFDDSKLALDLISYGMEFNTDGLTEENLSNDYEQIYNIDSERKDLEKNAPVLKKYALIMIKIKSILEKLDNKEFKLKGNKVYILDVGKTDFLAYINKTKSNIDSLPNNVETEIFEYISYILNLEELNSLSVQFNEIRNQISLGLNALSISVWNNYNNIEASLLFINFAFCINGLSNETNKRLLESKSKINEIINNLYSRSKTFSNKKPTYQEKKESAIKIKPLKNTPSLSTINGVGTKIYIDTLYFVFFFIPLLPLSRYAVENKGNSYTFYGKQELHFWQKLWKYGIFAIISILLISGIANTIASNNKKYNPTKPKTSNSSNGSGNSTNSINTGKSGNSDNKKLEVKDKKYIGNQLTNGASPLSNCFGKGKFGGPSYITFKNNNESDAVVCLVNVNSNKTIRNEYIRKGKDYKMKSVPSGTYFLKFISGNDWNPNLENFCGGKGNFQSDINYSKSDSPSDYIEIITTGRKYSYYNITLYSVYNGNMSQEPISESEFYK